MTASSRGSQAKDRFVRVCERIRTAAQQAGRDPAAVALLAVSKLQPAAKVSGALRRRSARFGENYVQEAVQKCASSRILPVSNGT